MSAHQEEVPVNYRWARIRFIIDKFRLPENYEYCVDMYIVHGKITAPYHNFSLGPWHERRPGQKFSEMRRIPVTFYTTPTIEDLRLVKHEVDAMAKRHGLPKFQPLKNIDRNLTIEEWYRNRERTDVVEQTTYKRESVDEAGEARI